MPDDSRNMFGSIFDLHPIHRVIVRVEVIAVREICAAAVIGIENLASRFFFLIINLDGWELLLNAFTKSFLFTPCSFLVDCKYIIIKLLVDDLTPASVFLPFETESIDDTPKPKSSKTAFNSRSLTLVISLDSLV